MVLVKGLKVINLSLSIVFKWEVSLFLVFQELFVLRSDARVEKVKSPLAIVLKEYGIAQGLGQAGDLIKYLNPFIFQLFADSLH